MEKTPEDALTHGILAVDAYDGDNQTLIVGGCSEGEISDENAMYVSLLSPTMAFPLADWLADAADLMAQSEGAGLALNRMLGRALQFSKKVNHRYRKIQATGIYEKRVS